MPQISLQVLAVTVMFQRLKSRLKGLRPSVPLWGHEDNWLNLLSAKADNWRKAPRSRDLSRWKFTGKDWYLQVLAARVFILVFLINVFCQVARADETPPENMVLVPAGEFLMGADNAEAPQPNQPRLHSDARPLHKATTGAFYIDKTEVTNAQYAEFCRATSIAPPAHWPNGEIPPGEKAVAVTRVDWYQATAYARWAGKRLPSETEWEKAARGADGRLYPWGDNFEGARLVWNALKAGNVGAHPEGASPYGALDMAGNVFEWTSDWYRAYPGAPFLFPEYGTQFKTIRGGGFGGFDFMTRTYYRAVASQRTRSEWLGFRCVRDVKTPK